MKTNVDNKLIVSLSTDSNTYADGKAIFLDGGAFDVQDEKTPTGGIIKFKLDLDDLYSVSIRIDHTGRIRGYGCSCALSKDLSGACKHAVAALFYLADQNDSSGNRIKTDFISDEISTSFKKSFMQEKDFLTNLENKKFVSLEPVLNFNASNKIFLTFKIGIKNSAESLKNFYVIKNVGDFVKNVQEREQYSYGKELGFVHNINKFDEESKELIKILISEKTNIDDITKVITKNNTFIKQNNFTATKEIYLSRWAFDSFFNIYENKTVSDFLFLSDVPKIKFSATVEREKISLIRSLEKYFVFLGTHCGYVVLEKNIFKVTRECALCLKFLGEAFEKTKNESVHFKKEGINDFLSFILPLLNKYNLIEKNYISEFYKVGYMPLKTKIFLDIKGIDIVATLEFNYGDTKIVYGEISDYFGYRDKLSEEEILEMLFYFGFVYEVNSFVLKKDKDIFELFKTGIYSLNNICEVFVTERFKEKEFKKEKGSTGLEVKIKGDLLELNINNSKYTTNELLEALAGYKISRQFYRLKSGKFVDMEDTDVIKTMSLMGILKNDLKDGKVVVNKNKSFFINELLHESSFAFEKDEEFDVLIDKINTIKEEKIVFSKKMEKTLRHYQKDGVNWLKNLSDLGFGAILADEMGLGKTIEIIGLIEVDKENSKGSYLIVCPTSLIYNWQKEFEKFGSGEEVLLITGAPFEREEIIKNINNCGKKIYVTTYDMVKRDIEFYEDIVFRYVVLDEAQNIKNPSTLSSISVKKLQRENGIALTGTPIENSLKELWSIFDFIIPGYLYSLPDFQSIYSAPIMNDNDEGRTNMLKHQITPFILRRFKKDVLLELPDKIETVLYADMTSEQELAYNAFFKEAKGELLDDGEVNHINIIRKLTRLRQISCHPKLFIENYHGGSGKLDVTLETIKNCISEGHRILLFSQFTSMLSILMKALDQDNIEYFYLDGKTKSKEREIMCARFNSGENNIFLISLKAGGTGLNLTGADVVIHYDPWWNPSVMNQASDRAHRFGQKKVVQIFNIISKNTIEEKIHKLQERKKELIDSVLTDEVKFIKKLSKDELISLFRD